MNEEVSIVQQFRTFKKTLQSCLRYQMLERNEQKQRQKIRKKMKFTSNSLLIIENKIKKIIEK